MIKRLNEMFNNLYWVNIDFAQYEKKDKKKVAQKIRDAFKYFGSKKFRIFREHYLQKYGIDLYQFVMGK